MEIITIAGYILAIMVIITLAVRVFWLLFGLMVFRTLHSLVTFDLVQTHMPGIEHWMYITILIIFSALIYFIVQKMTADFQWVRYVFLILLMFWVFRTYSPADVFLLRDWFTGLEIWDEQFWRTQSGDLRNADSELIQNEFTSIFQQVWNSIVAFWNMIRSL